MRMNPEIAQNVREFLVELEELTARTGIVVGSLSEDLAPVLELQTDSDVVVALMVKYDPDTGAYDAEEPDVLDPKIAVASE